MWSQDKLLNFWVLGTIQWGQASSLPGTVLSVLSPSSLFFFGHSLKAPCSSNPSLAPGYSWFLLAMGYGSPGAIMLCYSMAVCWMNSQSTLSLYAYLAAFSSSPSLTLRRLWISLIIIACVTDTWGGRYHPQEAFSVLTQCLCVCVSVSFMNCYSCLRQLPEGLYSIRAPPLSLLLKTCLLFPYTNNYGCSLSHTLSASHNYRVQCLHLRIYANSFWSPSRTVWWWELPFERIQACMCVCFLVDTILWRPFHL